MDIAQMIVARDGADFAPTGVDDGRALLLLIGDRRA